MRALIFIAITLLFTTCDKQPVLNNNVLSDYLEINSFLERADLVACAASKEIASSEPTNVFFYPINGATDFRYFEAERIADSTDFSKYTAKELKDEPVFNGYLWKFNNEPFSGERMGIVTYKTPGKIHVCSPIRLKTNVKPTEANADLVTVLENGTTPSFSWTSGESNENVIYFQVIADAENNLISGTYTIEKEFAFYDLSNVVFNITDSASMPILAPNKNYTFTLMGVSEDNWVNLIAEKEFSTY